MRQSILDSIVRFARTSDKVTALILIGSQARTEMKADEYSDTDVIMVVRDAGYFLRADSWLSEIGRVHLSFTEPTLDGQRERRVLFDGAQDVDFVIMDESAAAHALENGEAAFILGRGYRVLVDKRGFTMPPIASAPPTAFAPASEAVFLNAVHDFWYHTVWAAKKLLRRELWTAKFCVDGYLKQKLLWMIEQHEHTVRRSGRDTWYGGRFIERWADKDVLRDLRETFAHYDRADIARALTETMKLYRRLAQEAATACGFPYPAHADAYATAWVIAQLAPLLPQAPQKGVV
ncbi:MAG: aminoglycoside 6-adenylyltransferase [Bacillota bacterium]